MPLGFSFQRYTPSFYRAYLSYPLAFSFFSLFCHLGLLLFLIVSSAHLLHHHLWDERVEMLSILSPPPPHPFPLFSSKLVITRWKRQKDLKASTLPISFVFLSLCEATTNLLYLYFVYVGPRPLRTRSSSLFSRRNLQLLVSTRRFKL